MFASRVIRVLGLGPALIWPAIGASALGILTPLAQGPILLATAMVLSPLPGIRTMPARRADEAG